MGSAISNTGTSITVSYTAAPTPGSYTVAVRNPDGGRATYNITVVAPPTITSISPATVPRTGSRAVVITGTGFQSGATVTMQGGVVSGVSVTPPTRVNATFTSDNSRSGISTVRVTNPDGSFADATISIDPSVPTISSGSQATPYQPMGRNTTITLNGAQFLSGATVTVGGGKGTVSGTIINGPGTTATVSYVPSSTGSTVFTLTNPDGGTASWTGNVQVNTQSTPTVTGVSPNSMVRKTKPRITISGSGFVTSPQPTVTWNGAACTINSVATTSIQCTGTAPGSAGTYTHNVVVTNSDGGKFTYAWTYTVTN